MRMGQVPGRGSGDAAIRRLEEAIGRLRAATSGRERRGLSHDEADDVAGTVATDDAIGFNPLPLRPDPHAARRGQAEGPAPRARTGTAGRSGGS